MALLYSPCRNCQVANKPCVYVIRDRPVTVTESYLKTLEAAAAASTPNSIINQHYQETRPVVPNNSRIDDTETASPAPPRQPHALQVENSAAARFVSKLKEIQNPKALPNSVRQDLLLPVSGDGSTQPHIYEYFTLNSDTSHAKCTFKLPPYPYAIFLVNQFFTYVGHDWHWFRLERFRHRLENVYKIPDSAESKNRTWLCQLLVAFALGSSIRGQDPDSSPPRQNFAHAIQSIPGVEFFEQALGLLKIPYEEASVDHIETLNMVALCSHCLNRQKTTYMYAGISARMCNMLQLHETSSSMDCSPVERENCKRVWWSTFCIDRMASTQMGVLPTLQIDQGDLSYPTNEGLSGEEINEFSDPDYLTARIQLTIIQADAANGIGQSDGEDASDNDGDSYKRSIDTLLRSRLRRLQDWKAALPAHMAVDFHESIEEMKNNMALLRSLANLHLRYNQVF
ncbi:hypothetical protein SBRCBS47491_002738 [Sporothrix bragantina]|uniref:Xylanolytic transcriptional activator regulatory domain-containing protein n=1 Tax=Sporothrix bragantina TaxID=671064 RepID=A0ABP0B9G9_9PEZI